MERKQFLKTLGMGIIAVPLAAHCNNDELPPEQRDCVPTARETAGPFPTKDPVSLTMHEITGDREGARLIITLKVKDRQSNCAPREKLSVDIWHCDKDGNYSEYGGNGLQPTDHRAVHFLRGRQVTNEDGFVGFDSIFPGWYPGRAPHIHVHIHNAAGVSILVTQIAFPKDACDDVYTNYPLYSGRGTQDTTNESDNVFRDGVDTELAHLTGHSSGGYTLTHEITVNA